MREIELAKGFGFTYGGRHSSEYGVRVISDPRTITPPLSPVTASVPGRPGEYWVRMDYGPAQIEVEVRLVGESYAGLQRMRRELADWLTPELGPRPLVFDDEPDIYYEAYLSETDALEQLLTYGTATLRFTVPDGFGRGPQVRHLLGAPDAVVQRNSVAWNYKGNDVPPHRARLVSEDDELLFHGGVPQFDPLLSFVLWQKLLIEEGTTNLIRDPLLGSMTPIGAPGAPWQWIQPPDPGKGESWTKEPEDLLECWAGFRNLKVVANGTENVGIEQEIRGGWQPGQAVSVQGRFAIVDYLQGALRFEVVAKDAEGNVILQVPVLTLARETREPGWSFLDWEFAFQEGIIIPPQASSLWVRIYAINQPRMTFYVAGLQLEAKPYMTGLAANPAAVDLEPIQDDTQQHARLGDRVTWPASVVNPKEGFIGLWVFPISPRKSGMVYWSTGRPVPQGGDPTSIISVYSEGDQLIVNIGNGISAYAVAVPHDLLRLREWNFIGVNWKENEGLDVLVNRTLFNRVYIGEIMVAEPPMPDGYLGCGPAEGAEVNAIVDMFYVRRRALTLEELEAFAAAPDFYLVPAMDEHMSYLLYLDDDGTEWDPEPGLTSLNRPYFSRGGTAPVWPTIEVRFFQAANGFRLEQLETQRYVQVNYTFVPGDRLVIDCERQVVLWNGWPIMEYLDLGSDFFELRRGQNAFSWPRPLAATVEVVYEPRYL